MSEPKTRRLFFALWPDDDVRQQIKQGFLPHFSHGNGKPVRIENWHMTLAFLGMVNEAGMACYQDAAARITSAPFTLGLDHCGYFRRAAVAWLSCSEVPEPLTQLVNSLQLAIMPCGYTSAYRDWQAHMTLLRKARQAPSCPRDVVVTWPVSDFCLVESLTHPQGVQYHVLQRWPFQSP